MAGAEQSQRWSLKAKTALVTGGTKGIGFVSNLDLAPNLSMFLESIILQLYFNL